jgi:hypothetical protein
MFVDLTPDEIQELLTSLEYSRDKVRSKTGTPYEVRQENLAKLDSVATKLREARK